MKERIIETKSMDFAVRMVNLYKYLCEDKKEFVMSKQVLRSGTSVGANIRESRNAQSNADFISKMNIALKEADETCYWLELLHKTQYLSTDEYISMNSDAEELIKILISSIKTKIEERPII